jgi:hypothetical protein
MLCQTRKVSVEPRHLSQKVVSPPRQRISCISDLAVLLYIGIRWVESRQIQPSQGVSVCVCLILLNKSATKARSSTPCHFPIWRMTGLFSGSVVFFFLLVASEIYRVWRAAEPGLARICFSRVFSTSSGASRLGVLRTACRPMATERDLGYPVITPLTF